MNFNLKNTLEALLFSTAEPLSIKDVQAVITRYHEDREGQSTPSSESQPLKGQNLSDHDGQGVMQDLIDQVPSLLTATEIRDAMESIMQELTENNAVYRLVQGPSGYRITVNPAYAEWIRLLRAEPRPRKLSPASTETLAIIGYRQPITRAEIESIRGVSSDSALSTLLENELIRVTGRADLPGRPLQYGTTEKFLELCGLSSIEELPASDVLSPNQIGEWIRRVSAHEVELSDADMGLPEEEKR